MNTMGTNSETFRNIAGLQIHIPLVHLHAIVAGCFHCNVKVNSCRHDWVFAHLLQSSKGKSQTLTIASDFHGLSDDVFDNCPTIFIVPLIL